MSNGINSPTLELADKALEGASKTDLIHALRAIVTVKLWDQPDEELRAMLRDLLHAGEVSAETILASLDRG